MSELAEAYDAFPWGPRHYQNAEWSPTLQELHQAAIRHAESRIRNYDRRSYEVACKAKRLRWFSVFLFVFGTAAPVLQSTFEQISKNVGDGIPKLILGLPFTEIGYALLVFAGGLVIFDQFFDQSGTWMRCRQAQARLQTLLAEFRYAWVAELCRFGGPPTRAEDVGVCIRLIGKFVAQVEAIAEAETKEWATRFRAHIEAFDRQPSLNLSKLESDGADANGGEPSGGGGDTRSPPRLPDASPQEAIEQGSGEAATIILRAAFEDPARFDEGSLTLLVDGEPVAISAAGEAELSLRVGVAYGIAATGQVQGKLHRFSDRRTPTIDDDGDPYPISLAE